MDLELIMKKWLFVSLLLIALFNLEISACPAIKADTPTIIASTSGSVQPIELPINDAAILFMGILVIEIICLFWVAWQWRRKR
jgi:hypothetical protein